MHQQTQSNNWSYAEVVVKQLDPRWPRKGVTAALLKAAGYSTDVAIHTEFVGDLPAHLSCWSTHLGRSDVTEPKWQHWLQILLCASYPDLFSFRVPRSASRSLAACNTSTSSVRPKKLIR